MHGFPGATEETNVVISLVWFGRYWLYVSNKEIEKESG